MKRGQNDYLAGKSARRKTNNSMSLPGVGTPVRGSGKDQSIWKLEWTYGASGAVTLDADQSDQHPDIPATTAVVDTNTWITTVTVPKSTRMWLLANGLEPAGETTGTEYRIHEVTNFDAAAGTCVVRFFDVLGDATPAAEDPTSGSRYRLTLLLERP